MPRAVRRRMKQGVDLVREVQKLLGQRQVAETAMLTRVPAFLDIADDLATDIALPDAHRAREIAATIESHIASLSTDGIRGDVSGIDAITDETSRGICLRQLPIVDRVHLIAAVVQGVEQGLRALMIDGSASRRARDGPSPIHGSADALVPRPAKENPIRQGGSGARNLLSAELKVVDGKPAAAGTIRSAPTPDYEDP